MACHQATRGKRQSQRSRPDWIRLPSGLGSGAGLVGGVLGPQLTAFAARHGTTVAIHQADAYSVEWPADARWDVAWHDIWPTIALAFQG